MYDITRLNAHKTTKPPQGGLGTSKHDAQAIKVAQAFYRHHKSKLPSHKAFNTTKLTSTPPFNSILFKFKG